MKYILVHKDTMMKRALSKYNRGRSILFVALIGILIILLLPIYVLEASDYRTGEYLKGWCIKKGSDFSVEYTHSVQLTPVIEIYNIDEKGSIILKESYFYSYGAGLPATTPYKFEITPNGFRIYDINKKIDDLIYRTGAVIANHKINIKDKTYLFLDFSKPQTGVRFKVKKMPILQYVFKEVYHVRQ